MTSPLRKNLRTTAPNTRSARTTRNLAPRTLGWAALLCAASGAWCSAQQPPASQFPAAGRSQSQLQTPRDLVSGAPANQAPLKWRSKPLTEVQPVTYEEETESAAPIGSLDRAAMEEGVKPIAFTLQLDEAKSDRGIPRVKMVSQPQRSVLAPKPTPAGPPPSDPFRDPFNDGVGRVVPAQPRYAQDQNEFQPAPRGENAPQPMPPANELPAPMRRPMPMAEAPPMLEVAPMAEPETPEPPEQQALPRPMVPPDDAPAPPPAAPPSVRNLRSPSDLGSPGSTAKKQCGTYNDRDCCADERECTKSLDRLKNDRLQAYDKSLLDITPRYKPDADTPEEIEQAEERKKSQLIQAGPRAWKDHHDKVLAEGRLLDLSTAHAIIAAADGRTVKVPLAKLSDDDLCFIAAWYGLPTECTLGNDPFSGRQWVASSMQWTASGLCHKPLYFEDVQLERYGHSHGPIKQPVVSAAHFFANIAILPYKMGINPPNECQYALGYYRPGSCSPYMWQPFPLSVRGAAAQAGAVLGVNYALP